MGIFPLPGARGNAFGPPAVGGWLSYCCTQQVVRTIEFHHYFAGFFGLQQVEPTSTWTGNSSGENTQGFPSFKRHGPMCCCCELAWWDKEPGSRKWLTSLVGLIQWWGLLHGFSAMVTVLSRCISSQTSYNWGGLYWVHLYMFICIIVLWVHPSAVEVWVSLG